MSAHLPTVALVRLAARPTNVQRLAPINDRRPTVALVRLATVLINDRRPAASATTDDQLWLAFDERPVPMNDDALYFLTLAMCLSDIAPLSCFSSQHFVTDVAQEVSLQS